jgi:predicted PurR-regulated permease PerM
MRTESFYGRAFVLFALALLAFLLYLVLQPLLAPIAWALFIAFLVDPLHEWIVRRRRGAATLSAALLTAATVIVVLGPLTALGAAFGQEAGELLRRAQAFAVENKPESPSDLETLPIVGPAIAWLREWLGLSQGEVYRWAAEGARTVLKTIGSLTREAALGAMGTAVGFALAMFILFFAIRDGRAWFARYQSLVPLPPNERERLFEHLRSVARAVVYGSGVTALLQGALVGVGFALTGLPSPVVFGVIAAVLALVPFAGTPLVWAPAVVFLAIQDRWYAASFLLAWGLFTTIIDNFVRPMLASSVARIGTLTVFIGVIGGISAFGMIGFVLGPLVLALFLAILGFMLERDDPQRRSKDPTGHGTR